MANQRSRPTSPAARVAMAAILLGCAAPCHAAGVIPPHGPPLSCARPDGPEAAAICADPILRRFHRSNEATEADAGARHPAEAVTARDRERAALAACGTERECLRRTLAGHATELTLMLSR